MRRGAAGHGSVWLGKVDKMRNDIAIRAYLVIVSILLFGGSIIIGLTTGYGVSGGAFAFIMLYLINGVLILIVGGFKIRIIRTLIAWYPALLSDRARDWMTE